MTLKMHWKENNHSETKNKMQSRLEIEIICIAALIAPRNKGLHLSL